ncbi:hypothetical protein CDAR_19001 [Caerostris darwini]|uniref:Uncharacterized protein n=1 Tax=Caerostris darwini TaxID=1538125 RepID=A0AAV4WCZ7_9ARAC|nr:hypothetical protein CDAR_19001 [Caerostris darwini]
MSKNFFPPGVIKRFLQPSEFTYSIAGILGIPLYHATKKVPRKTHHSLNQAFAFLWIYYKQHPKRTHTSCQDLMRMVGSSVYVTVTEKNLPVWS